MRRERRTPATAMERPLMPIEAGAGVKITGVALYCAFAVILASGEGCATGRGDRRPTRSSASPRSPLATVLPGHGVIFNTLDGQQLRSNCAQMLPPGAHEMAVNYHASFTSGSYGGLYRVSTTRESSAPVTLRFTVREGRRYTVQGDWVGDEWLAYVEDATEKGSNTICAVSTSLAAPARTQFSRLRLGARVAATRVTVRSSADVSEPMKTHRALRVITFVRVGKATIREDAILDENGWTFRELSQAEANMGSDQHDARGGKGIQPTTSTEVTGGVSSLRRELDQVEIWLDSGERLFFKTVQFGIGPGSAGSPPIDALEYNIETAGDGKRHVGASLVLGSVEAAKYFCSRFPQSRWVPAMSK